MYKNIVVGYDGSERAKRAVEQAADLATALGSRLHFITAVAKDEIHKVGESTDEQYLSCVEIAEGQLTDLASDYNHLDFRAKATVGAPARVLLDEAERVDADLIFVGNKHCQGISRVLGSVAEDVAQKASCAVLVAKTA